MQVGDVFLGANGELLTLAATERVVFPEGIKVYNFSVEDNHNYFILAQVGEFGQTCVLVHNAARRWCEADADDLPSYPKPNKVRDQVREKNPPTMRPGHITEASQIKAVVREFKLSKRLQSAWHNICTVSFIRVPYIVELYPLFP